MLYYGACPANFRSPFDALRANGMGIEKIDVFRSAEPVEA
jgi:hypothetical protein